MSSNVVLVTVDSLRADHLSCYGYGRETTPRLDEYAERGHRFTAAFSHACATRPSLPAILTSSHPLMYGEFERLSGERTLISEVLSDRGYATGGFHSNLYLSAQFGYGRGFDTFYDSRDEPSLTERLRRGVKDRLNTQGFLFNALQRVYDRAERTTGVNIGTYHTPAAEITDRVLEFADGTAGTDRPTFIWVHYMDPHHPYAPPAEYQTFSSVDRREGVRLRPKMLSDDEETTEEERQTLIDLYDDEIRYTDAEIGRLFAGLEERWDEWTAFVTADHGEEFRDHGEYSHQNRFYDEVMHVPLIVFDGQGSGTHEELVGLVDVAPTIAERAGVTNVPDSFWGYSLEPLLSGTGEWPRNGVRGSWCDLSTGKRRLVYRTEDWKYIRDEVDERELLFDLRDDPEERHNLAEREDPPAEIESMRDAVDRYEDDIESTATAIGEVEMGDEVKERLRRLGYQE